MKTQDWIMIGMYPCVGIRALMGFIAYEQKITQLEDEIKRLKSKPE